MSCITPSLLAYSYLSHLPFISNYLHKNGKEKLSKKKEKIVYFQLWYTLFHLLCTEFRIHYLAAP